MVTYPAILWCGSLGSVLGVAAPTYRCRVLNLDSQSSMSLVLKFAQAASVKTVR